MLLGDFIADTTKKLGVPECLQCIKRQEALNQFHLKVKKFIAQNFSGSSSGSSSSPTSES